MYDKLPMFYGQLMLQEYVQDPAISFCAFGDTASDKAPLQVSDFGQGAQIDQMVSKLYLEGGGGANLHESYELVAFFYLSNCQLINTELPYFFITGDEYYYNEIFPFVVDEFLGLKPNIDSIKSKDIWDGLKRKFNVFHLHKPYPGDEDKKIKEQWINTLGIDRVLEVETPKACIDVILGAIAITSGTRDLEAYIEDMRDRGQTEERIREVRFALRNVLPEVIDIGQYIGGNINNIPNEDNYFNNNNNNVPFNNNNNNNNNQANNNNDGYFFNNNNYEEEKKEDLGQIRKKVSEKFHQNRPHDVVVNMEKLKAFEQKFRDKIPQDFYCPITNMLFVDPVVASDGNTYERGAIDIWLKEHDKSPLTNERMASKVLTQNTILKKLMNDFIEKNS